MTADFHGSYWGLWVASFSLLLCSLNENAVFHFIAPSERQDQRALDGQAACRTDSQQLSQSDSIK
jgi:hypothetical protein